MSRRRSAGRAALAVALLCTTVISVAPSATATTCARNHFDVASRTLRRGATLTVSGEHWGTQCFDAIPPGARGVMGDPQINLTLTLVQEPRHLDVAHGDAEHDYSWRVDVTVPVDLAPGPAALEVATPAPFAAYSSLVLEITDEPPLRGGPTAAKTQIVPFGPGATAIPTSAADTSDSSDSSDGRGRDVIVATIASAALVAAALLALRLRRRTTV